MTCSSERQNLSDSSSTGGYQGQCNAINYYAPCLSMHALCGKSDAFPAALAHRYASIEDVTHQGGRPETQCLRSIQGPRKMGADDGREKGSHQDSWQQWARGRRAQTCCLHCRCIHMQWVCITRSMQELKDFLLVEALDN